MLSEKTVLVVGAGASAEVGLPSGPALTERISDLLRFDNTTSGHDPDRLLIMNALMEYHRKFNFDKPYDTSTDATLANNISLAMTEASSIDNYLQAHNNDEKISFIGKIAIALEISRAERSSALFVDYGNGSAFNPLSTKKTWYHTFWQMLHQNVSLNDISTIFENLTIISFNYDRCIHHRLFHGLLNYYHLSDHQSIELIKSLKVLYPYGSLGKYSSKYSFGENFNLESLIDTSKGLKTFSEQIEDQDCLHAIRQSICDARKIMFLGFGYHAQNMAVLTPEGDIRRGKRIFATAHNISAHSQSAVENLIQGAIHGDHHIRIAHDTCERIFHTYWYDLIR